MDGCTGTSATGLVACDNRAVTASGGHIYSRRRSEPMNGRSQVRTTMAVPTHTIIDTRRHQMFPALEPAEVERMRRFGEVRAFAAGEALATVGNVGLGLNIILAGKVD